MDLLENKKLPNWLHRLNSNDYKKFNTFMWNGSHVRAVLRYVLRQNSYDSISSTNDLLYRLEASRDTRHFPRMVLSFTDRLPDFFRVPTSESLTSSDHYKTNEVLAIFLDFLLDTAQEAANHHANLISPVEDEMNTLQQELRFLITILGDTPFCCSEEGQNFMEEARRLAEAAGRFLYEYFFTEEGKVSRMGLSLSALLRKFKNLERSIRQRRLKLSKLPWLTLPNVVESTCIVNSMVNDLLDPEVQDLISDAWDEIRPLVDELMELKSFLKLLNWQQNQELSLMVGGAAYEAEYVINSYVVEDLPVWYVNFRLPLVVQKMKLIRIGLERMKQKHDSKCILESFMVGDVPVCYFRHRTLSDFDDVKINVWQKDSMDGTQEGKKMSSIDDIVVGFDKEAVMIADQLTGGPARLQCIFIFGMPGLGKTTLAKKLYNNRAVLDRFRRCIWSVASEAYQKRRLLVDVLKLIGDLDRHKLTSMDVESLGVELHKILTGRRFFIVIDDVWSPTVWDDVRRFLPDNENGSRVLITSRIKDVAPPESSICALPFLSDDHCWNLLQEKVFRERDCPEELVETGKEIARHCQGLPLAVVVIAAVLANMNDNKSSWNEVSRSLSRHISNDHQSKCMDIMELSYKHLSTHLKPCFLYLGVFPEDSKISVQKLASLWIAEGFVQKEGEKSVWELAVKYLEDLVDRSLVIVDKRDYFGRIKACMVHDLVRELCLRKAKEENFLKLIKDQFSLYEKHHRVCIPFESANVESRPFGLHIRSWMGHWSGISSIYSRLKRLRVLDASVSKHQQDSQTVNDADLTGIEQLVHLRYLAISLTEHQMPPSMGYLQNLEFLLLDGLDGVEIPKHIFDLVKLSHLHVRNYGIFTESCRRRATVEKDLQMNNLVIVSNLRIDHEDDERILRCTPHIRRMKCMTGPFRDSSNKCSRYLKLDYLTLLESLSMSYLGCNHKFSDALNLPQSLKKLTLNKFELSWKEMSMIGKLAKLEVLKLLYPTFDGKEWNTNPDEFQQLKFLKLEGSRIYRWNTLPEHFPELKFLVLHNCWKLKQLPLSLAESETLKIIDMHCNNKSMEASLKKFEKQLGEIYNEQLELKVNEKVIWPQPKKADE